MYTVIPSTFQSIDHLFTHVSSSELKARSKYVHAGKNENDKMKNIMYLYVYKKYICISCNIWKLGSVASTLFHNSFSEFSGSHSIDLILDTEIKLLSLSHRPLSSFTKVSRLVGQLMQN